MKKHLITCILFFAVGFSAMAQHRSVTWEKLNAVGPELKQIGHLATRHSKDISSSQWSVGCETLDRDYAEFENYKQYVGELGVKSARLQSGWAKCEPKKGKYNFEWLDNCVYGLDEQGVKPWICLCYGNPIYGAEKVLGSKIFTDDVTMNAWLKYVEATVKRYKNTVTEWEVWNEPNLNESPEIYANLLMKSAEIIKKVQPEATIIGFTVHDFTPGSVLRFPKAVFEVLKSKGKLDIVDYITYHPYTHNPDTSYPMVEGLRKLIDEYNPDIKLFQGEVGCPSILEWGHALHSYSWTEYSQAKWNLRQMINDWSIGARYNVFTLVDLQYPNMLQSFGLIRMNLLKEVVYKRPSYYAVQHTVNVLDGNVNPAGEPEYKANTLRDISIVKIKNDQPFGIMLWYGDRIPSDDLTWDLVDITVKDLTFRDPVYVEMITGRVYEIPDYNRRTVGNDTKFRDLPVWDSPVLIAERSQVKIK